jgi:hypothetical protein
MKNLYEVLRDENLIMNFKHVKSQLIYVGRPLWRRVQGCQLSELSLLALCIHLHIFSSFLLLAAFIVFNEIVHVHNFELHMQFSSWCAQRIKRFEGDIYGKTSVWVAGINYTNVVYL